MAEKNKRSHPRFDSLNLLSYVVYDEEGTMIRQGMGRTLNVSASGILLETHVPVADGHKVALTIGLEDDLIDIRGESVYSRAGENNMYNTGISFTDVDAKQRSILDEFIKAFEADRP